MLNFSPFRVILTSVSPVVINRFAPSLDGMLYEALAQANCNASSSEILSSLRDILQFNDRLGVFHASSLTFGITPEKGIMAVQMPRCDSRESEKFTSEMIAPFGARNPYPRILLTGGPTKKRVNERPGYCAPYLSFDAVGDVNRIQDLLENAFLGVGYDPFSGGYGEYSLVQIIPLESDTSIFSDGHAVRPVPAESGGQGIRAFSPLLPPYYSGEKVAVVVPEPVRVLPVQNLL